MAARKQVFSHNLIDYIFNPGPRINGAQHEQDYKKTTRRLEEDYKKTTRRLQEDYQKTTRRQQEDYKKATRRPQ